MISKILQGVGLLIPLAALASAGEESPGQESLLQSWSLEALCSARLRDDVLAEIKRRDVFSRPELRAIRNGEVRQGISLEALTCVKGPPTIVVDAAEQVHLRPVAAYIHLTDGSAGLLSYVSEESGESTVVYSLESADPAAIARNPSVRLLCDRNIGPPSRCRLVGDDHYIWAGTDAACAGRCGERLCDAVNAFPDVAPLPPVREDAQ